MTWPFLLAALIAVLITVSWRYRTPARTVQAEPPEAPKPVGSAKTQEALSQRLHNLSQKIEEFINAAAHPQEMSSHTEFNEAVTLFCDPDVALDTLVQYATGSNANLACPAFVALARHPQRDKAATPVLARLGGVWPYPLYFALLFLDGVTDRPAVGAPLAAIQPWWARNPILAVVFAEYFDRRTAAGDTSGFGNALDAVTGETLDQVDAFLQAVSHPTAQRLRTELKRLRSARVDRTFLESFGRFWNIDDAERLLVEPDPWLEDLALAAESVLHNPPHSVLVSGLSRMGKTSFLKLLWLRLSGDGWSVFEASGAELMAGQSYFGQLEERIRQVVTQLDSSKRIAWYVSDLLQIAQSGTHRGQSASILDQILPAIAAGRLVVFGEASPAGVARLLQVRPSLRSLLDVYRLEPMNEPEAADLTEMVAGRMEIEANLEIERAAVAATLHLSQHYLGTNPFPGTALDLLKMATNRIMAADTSVLKPGDVLATLSQLTGLPLSILDDSERIDLAQIRKFFSERVIGQEEAVGAIVDRIAMLKAGLTDSSRPIGVFLFAGPTGTGKTELAKTLAEYLFGSADRMIRLDMSEFQNADSTSKILGERGYSETSDSLIDRVRKQPFSVVLLDEFEKAHPNVWDLFLQLFDDGRLTDANGRTGDFRHSIVVLTSNLGATTHRGMGLGFLPDGSTYSDEQVMRAVAKSFRPEFVNRLDRIIVFKPLSRAFMREILRKELKNILERRGLRQRDWAVEWEPSAIEFLLDQGFTSDMGARPLKRAIDRHLLAPLASTLVEHRFPQGDQFLFVRSNGSAIEVEFVDPDAEDAGELLPSGETGNLAALARMILSPEGGSEDRKTLAASWTALSGRLSSPEWLSLKEELQGRFADPGLWSTPDRHRVFARFSMMDRVEEAARTAERLKHRLDVGRERDGHAPRGIVSRLALQVFLVEQGIADVLEDAPVDALLIIEPALDASQSRVWCERLLQMYRGWSDRRHMQFAIIQPPGGAGAPILQVSGFGAYRTLKEDAGLHVLEEENGSRLVARVAVAPGPVEEPKPADAYRVLRQGLSQPAESGNIVRRYREKPAPLVRDLRKGWRSGRLDAVLAGDFDLIGTQQ